MQQEPYRSARRVFWITDNGSSHRGQTSIERLSKWYPNAIQVHTPFTSCKKMEQDFADLLARAGKKREETTEKMMLRLTGRDINMCTQCQKGQMIVIGELPNLYWNTS